MTVGTCGICATSAQNASSITDAVGLHRPQENCQTTTPMAQAIPMHSFAIKHTAEASCRPALPISFRTAAAIGFGVTALMIWTLCRKVLSIARSCWSRVQKQNQCAWDARFLDQQHNWHDLRIFCEPIGDGATGIVYKGRLLCAGGLGRCVATKISWATNSARGSLKKEYDILLAAQGHRNVPECYGFGELSGGRTFMVMELMEMSLKQFLADRWSDHERLSFGECIEIFREIARALQHLQNKRIIHYDLKPSNVLVAVRQSMRIVKVSDFGCSENRPLTEITGEYRGTPGYIAPELMPAHYSHKKVNGKKVDVYSFGCLMGHCMSGSDNHDMGFSQNVQCPHDLRSLIGRCSNNDPEVRPSWEEVLEDLDNFVDSAKEWLTWKISQ
ncbi:unnamed protein product [Ostreobium quekettii]|uniref:Protein kinase domain-containing protein n=1 Tax=Ostreobium quekettii TaxID=121088 RepID=A0A8S1JDL2_9CHLO|nr:unnamed protein product [Ostreobium quekettii]|eukprot:evm.model.scf_355.5 EVM.evm.TU.scf_355.5   scf_355:63727-64887(+)